jgi:hypothetical protein
MGTIRLGFFGQQTWHQPLASSEPQLSRVQFASKVVWTSQKKVKTPCLGHSIGENILKTNKIVGVHKKKNR